MRYYESTSTIAASPEAVWGVLSDGAAWIGLGFWRRCC
jgi:carbon monoxide dehydrogenase subunit G